ncbi:MAG: hypothetical protein K2X87_30885 [Gemmataceae bacterium]|nr:hypothetical protein [Gemmataceae bacterium]
MARIERKMVAVGDERRRPWKAAAALLLVKTTAVAAACVAVGRGAEWAWTEAVARVEVARAAVVDRLTVTRVVTEYREPDAATLAQVIRRVAAERGVDPLVLAVIAEKESAGGAALYRFEPGKFEQLRGSKRYKGKSTDELRMIASSHGPFHVMGYSAEAYCGLPWHRMYDTLSAARCAGEIVARLYADTDHVKDPSARVRAVFKGYNGAGEDAERYADDAMARLAAILYKRVAQPAPK